MKEFSAPGPDGIRPKILKEQKRELAKPLTILFSKSMEEGKIPYSWRKANITPIFKKGRKNNPGNYRPVPLMSIVCKLMEKIVKEALVNHL